MANWRIIGLMSGTSMDGLDIAFINFSYQPESQWNHEFINSKSIPYPTDLKQKLRESVYYSSVELLTLDKQVGKFFAEKVNEFIEENKYSRHDIDAIASHGHTIFHQPANGFTYQIGCGDTISYHTGIKVINDFRQKDVIAGGQGAPLVPIGDKLLFGNLADSFLNIGGFCNICFPGEITIAFDICPGNLPLNAIMQELGKDYDKDGVNARKGNVDHAQLNQLNNLSYYRQKAPKSLGTEWLQSDFLPVLNQIENKFDRLRTCCEHIAYQIAKVIMDNKSGSVFITGGGAKNDFLMELIRQKSTSEIIIPDTTLIDFKEALIFAFLGALYLNGNTNTLRSVTGAERNVIGGVLHLP